MRSQVVMIFALVLSTTAAGSPVHRATLKSVWMASACAVKALGSKPLDERCERLAR